MSRFAPFLLVAQFTVVSPEGGVGIQVKNYHVPSESACVQMEKRLRSRFNWARQKRVNGKVRRSMALGIVKTECVPMRDKKRGIDDNRN